MKTVLVFKTSVSRQQEVEQLQPMLNRLMTTAEKWNFDLEDVDNILRVEAIQLNASTIIEKLAEVGFACAELED